MKEKISVIGIGRLGLSFALLLESKGYEVMGCDVNEKYIDSLKDKTFVSKEPGVNEMLKDSKMEFTTNTREALNYAELIFVFVPTPSKPGGNYDHKHVDQVVNKIQSTGASYKTLVIGCTVMPMYCQSIRQKLSHANISVLYSPEFISQGNIIEGLKNSDIVLIGGDNINPALFGIYKNIMNKEPNFKILSLTGAEIAKISINCFLTMKIAFADLIGEIVINSDEEDSMAAILETIGSDSRIGNKCLSYGFPPGGPCLGRDQKALNFHAYSVRIVTNFCHAIDLENNRHSSYLLEYYEKQNPDKTKPFIFSSLAYKSGTDILTDSYQLKLCLDLLRFGYTVDVPISIKDADTPEEFKDHCYNDKVTFGANPEGYKIN